MVNKPNKLILIIITALCVVVSFCAVMGYRYIVSAKKYFVPESLNALLALSNEELKEVDIAVINLLCAEGLPGSENIDIGYCLKTLEEWAEHVLETEEKYRPAFYRNPAKYDNSYALFQGVYLDLALELDFKCGYNKKQVESGAMADLTSLRMFADSKDLFLHGFVDRTAPRTGTCGSLPLLMTAIGRRCGYPVYFVVNKGHAFCRWDDGRNRFNFEVANGRGAACRTDAYYMAWPHPISKEELKVELFMQNLDAVGELVASLEQRAACLRWHKRYEEACEVYVEILRRMPHLRSPKVQLDYVRKRCNQ